MKQEYESYMRITPCKACGGKRLKKSSLAVTVGGKDIYDATDMSIVKFRDFADGLALTETQRKIGEQILKEIHNRVSFLIDVGLDYLSLSAARRPSRAARRSAYAWRPRSAPVSSVWPTFWTSRA